MLLLLSLLSPLAWSGERVERRLAAMGTTLELSVQARDRTTALLASEAAVRAVAAVEARLSTWRSGSELSLLGAAPLDRWVDLSPELLDDLELARWCHEQTGGAFDPAIGALVAAWDLRGIGREPTPAEVERALAGSGLDGLQLQGDRARRTRDLAFDAGGFGKGVGLDAGLQAALDAGAAAVTLGLGGQVATWGQEVPVDLAHPARRSELLTTVPLSSGSLATSGHGEQPGHILDPRSGRPTDAWGSVTVWAPTAGQADCLATGLYVLGPRAALDWAAANPGYQVIVAELDAGGGALLRGSPLLLGELQ